MPFTTAFKNKMLDVAVKGGTGVGITHVSLHTAAPDASGSNEVTGGSYARKAITWNSASGGSIDDSNAPVLDVPSGVTVTHVGYWYDNAGTPIFAAWSDVTDESFGAAGTYTVSDADLDLNAV